MFLVLIPPKKGGNNMNVISAYRFERKPEDPLTRFILVDHSGIPFRDFPSTYVRGSETGKQYIILRDTQQSRLKYFFSHMLEWKSGKCLTGFNLVESEYGIGNDRSFNMDHFILIHTDRKSFIELSFVNAAEYYTQKHCLEVWLKELRGEK